MENLISMTDYVLEQYTLFINENINSEQFRENVWNYAKFLSMPLELKMFVACDDEGNVLEEPNIYNKWAKTWKGEEGFEDCERYNQALSEVIFEGFEISYFNYGGGVVDKNSSFELRNKDIQVCYYKAQPNYFVWNYKTIEDLVKYNLKLTPNAKLKYKF